MTSFKTLLGMMFNPDHEEHTTLTQVLSMVWVGMVIYVVIMGTLGAILGWFRA